MIESEISILTAIEHPNIIQLEEVFDFPGEKYLVMEYVQVNAEIYSAFCSRFLETFSPIFLTVQSLKFCVFKRAPWLHQFSAPPSPPRVATCSTRSPRTSSTANRWPGT